MIGAEQNKQDEYLYDPVGRADVFKYMVGDLQDQPGSAEICDGDAKHIAPFQFVKELTQSKSPGPLSGVLVYLRNAVIQRVLKLSGFRSCRAKSL